MNNCEWKNLNSDYFINYKIRGILKGRLNKGDLVTPLIKGTLTENITLRNNSDWWGDQLTIGNERVITIPLFDQADFREFTLTANTNVKASAVYRKQGKFLVGIYTDYIDGSVQTVPFIQPIYKSPNSTNVPEIEVSVDYDSENQTLLIKYPSSYNYIRRLEVV